MVDEAELLQRLRNREQKAINEAIELYTPYLSTVLYNLAGTALPKEDAEEIVADVFVILWKNTEHIDLQKGTLRSYLAVVARNAGIKRLKKRQEHVPIDDIEVSDPGDFAKESS